MSTYFYGNILKNMNLIGYVRISTVKQDSGFSIESQKESILSYCSLYNHNLLEFYEDRASGTTRNKGLLNALEKLYNGNFQGIIVDKLDRLFRNTRDLLLLVEEFKKRGKVLISIKEQFDLSSPTGELCLVILSGFAEFERNRIKERVLTGKNSKRKLGAFTGGTIKYGYQSVSKKVKGKNIKILIEDSKEQEIISIMRSEREKGKSFREISDILNNKGIKTRRRKQFCGSTVFRIINSL